MCLEQRYRQWRDERIDLSGRNELINAQLTSCATFIPSEKAVLRLLGKKSLLISEHFTKKVAENRRPATGVIKKTIELEEQSEIKCLRLISSFASWKGGSAANPNEPSRSLSFFFVFPLRIK